MHPVQLKNFKHFHYSSVDNPPKLTKIGKNWLQRLQLSNFSIFCDWQVIFM